MAGLKRLNIKQNKEEKKISGLFAVIQSAESSGTLRIHTTHPRGEERKVRNDTVQLSEKHKNLSPPRETPTEPLPAAPQPSGDLLTAGQQKVFCPLAVLSAKLPEFPLEILSVCLALLTHERGCLSAGYLGNSRLLEPNGWKKYISKKWLLASWSLPSDDRSLTLTSENYWRYGKQKASEKSWCKSGGASAKVAAVKKRFLSSSLK